MSHNTTSWKSHSSTWRWIAGQDGRSPEGGKARRVGGRPALARQKTVGQHDQREVPMQAIPASALIVVQPTLALGVFIELLDGPAAVGQLDQPTQRGVRRQGAKVPLAVTAFAGHRALAKQPPLRSRADAVMPGGELRATGGPVYPHRRELFAEDDVVVLAPGDRLPAVLRQGLEDGRRRIQRRRARLLGLAPPPQAWRGRERGGEDFVGQAYPKAAADAYHVSALAGRKAQQEGRVVTIASVGDDPGKRDAPRPRLIHQGECQLRFRPKGACRGDMDFGPAGVIGGRGLGEIEPGGEGPMHGGTACRLIRDIVSTDNDLAIGDLAERAGILAGDPDRAAPLLGQPGVVEDQDALGWTLRDQGRHALLVEG